MPDLSTTTTWWQKRMTIQLLSLCRYRKHTAVNLMMKLQNQSSVCNLGCPRPVCTYEHLHTFWKQTTFRTHSSTWGFRDTSLSSTREKNINTYRLQAGEQPNSPVGHGRPGSGVGPRARYPVTLSQQQNNSNNNNNIIHSNKKQTNKQNKIPNNKG